MQRLVEEGGKSTYPTLRAYAQHIQGLIEFEKGRVGRALRHMDQDEWSALDDARWQRDNPLRRDLRMFAPLFRG